MRVIGVTPSLSEQTDSVALHRDYLNAVLRAGALPVVLPPTDEPSLLLEMLGRVDGLLLSGGGDIDPARYGEEMLPGCGHATPLRDDMELCLCRQAIERGLPILAICRGIQVLNCALGGSLYQDIGSQLSGALRHARQDAPKSPVHTVSVTPGTLLARVTGQDSLGVNSRHHQAVKALAPGLVVSARSDDGLIEGVEMPGRRFIVGVQWHPESMSEDVPEEQALFGAFVKACGGNHD